MGSASESIVISASLAETWDHYFDARGWPSWVDGFQRAERTEGYPDMGGALVWHSIPAGRGRVSERVLEHSPRRRHRIAFEDPQSSGELATDFAIEGEGTRVTLTVDYELSGGGPFSGLTDRLFVRSQVERSLARSLLRLKHEVEETARFSDAEKMG